MARRAAGSQLHPDDTARSNQTAMRIALWPYLGLCCHYEIGLVHRQPRWLKRDPVATGPQHASDPGLR